MTDPMGVSANTRADAPSWSRALASAGFVIYAGKHQGVPCTIRLAGLIEKWWCQLGQGDLT